jgi:hypothetical protein
MTGRKKDCHPVIACHEEPALKWFHPASQRASLQVFQGEYPEIIEIIV